MLLRTVGHPVVAILVILFERLQTLSAHLLDLILGQFLQSIQFAVNLDGKLVRVSRCSSTTHLFLDGLRRLH